MKQNKYFSPGRFARLLQNDWLIHQKAYLFTLAGISIALYVFTFLLMKTSNKFHNDDYIGLFMVNLATIGIVVGNSFTALKNRNKACNYLLTPGSTFEKYMVQFVVRILIFIPITLFIFWLCMYLAKASLLFLPENEINPSGNIPDFHFNILRDVFNRKDIASLLFGIFSGYSLLFAGSVYFKRFAIPKTLIFFGITLGIVFLAFVVFSHLFFPRLTNGFNIDIPIYNNESGTTNLQIFVEIIFGLAWLFFLPLAYFKLKEKEV